MPGVHSFISAKDIPGINSYIAVNAGILGAIELVEVFLSMDSEVLFHGQPCGMILADNQLLAEEASKHVEIRYEKMVDKKMDIIPSLSHWLEDNKIDDCEDSKLYTIAVNTEEKTAVIGAEKKIIGDMEMGSQYHFTMEPQTCFAYPNENGGVDIYGSVQLMDAAHTAVARCLNIPQSKINMVVRRIGGGYGAKVSQSCWVTTACALAAFIAKQPVRFVLTIEANMRTVGKRFANVSNYTANIDSGTGRLIDLSLSITHDFGYTFNDDIGILSVDALEKTCYARTSKWNVKMNRLKTDATCATWCRGPGTLEGIAVIENLMEHIARETNLDPAQVRLNNIQNDTLKKVFPEFLKDTEYYERKAKIKEFNAQNRWHKKGIAVSIMYYPVVYFSEFPTYVAVYHGDGTVVISHGGVEIGQGIHTRVAQVAAHTLNIPMRYITVAPTDSVMSANRTMTGGGITSESVCMATKKACEKILERLKPVRNSMPNASWKEICQAAYDQVITLEERHTFKASESKNYSVVGCACAEIDVDVITGNFQLTRVDIVEDTGESISPLMDVGQIEGAFMMGVGYWLFEKLEFNRQTGELLTNRSWNYKVPGPKDIPIDFRIKFLQNENNNDGILRSKTCGETSICLAIVCQFALRHAIESMRADNKITEQWYRMGGFCFGSIYIRF